MPGDPRAYTLFETRDSLAEASRRWAEAPVLGLDTEFVRTNTFFHKLGLIPKPVVVRDAVWRPAQS